jgi:tRNA(Ile)-lysidine synthetase-like protein
VTGDAEFEGLSVSWTVCGDTPRSNPKPLLGKEMFDADRVGRRVTLRHWQPGDRFQPIGMKNPVKLQDFFVNAKVPRAKRHRLVVAVSECGAVFWVEGLRISERFKLTPDTTRSLQWVWKRL